MPPRLPLMMLTKPEQSDDISSANITSELMSRRTIIRSLLSLVLLQITGSSEANAASSKLETLVTPIVMCQRLMGPVDKYITQGAWDKGRTNVNYCTRILAMRRNMKDAANQLQGDAYYDALDIMGDMENIMSQLDASLYTPLFIPADEGDITPEQSKYQTQARGFYDQALDGLDRFLKLIPNDILDRAIDIANNTKYEINVEHY